MNPLKHALRLCLGMMALAGAATAQDYPNKPIRMISPVTAGGPSDIALRPLAQELSKALGQPVIVENRPGAGGTLAGRACAQAAPDGYTICNFFNDVVSNAPYPVQGSSATIRTRTSCQSPTYTSSSRASWSRHR